MPMRPPLREAPRYPVTVVIGALAIGVSAWWWTGHQITSWVTWHSAVLTRPWTLVTCVFPHLDVIHLIFNLYWWWRFGAAVERVWGRGRLIGVVVLLAVISSALQVALDDPGVGLSGVGYGLCALLYVAQRRYPEFQCVVTKQTLQLFAAWFVVCVVLTVAGIWRVGNVAHGAGAAAGWVLGMCVVAEPRRRSGWVAALVGMVAVAGASATVAYPWVNFSSRPTMEAYNGHAALSAGRIDEAIVLLESAAKQRPKDAGVLVNLGIAYQKKDRHREAVELYKRAVTLDPSTREMVGPSIAAVVDRDAAAAAAKGDVDAVRSLAQEALRWSPGDEYARKMLEWVKEAEAAKGDGGKP